MRRPATLAEVAQTATMDRAEWRSALAGFLDDFYMKPQQRKEMIAVEPPMLEQPVHDAYLGAIAEHLARRWGLSIPDWTADPRRTLHRPFFATSIEALKPMLLAQSPLSFRKRMIFVEAEPLKRARMPRTLPASSSTMPNGSTSRIEIGRGTPLEHPLRDGSTHN